ncbi:uncharacterized protein LOC142505043 [Primulina tabacum]|uniref:uncharacterized protein LOC142505043 n=1 Tax=Primulina tabacum TaxID=48773 RepID=UPI003F590CDF
MEESKRGYFPMCHGVNISNSIFPKADEEIETMSRIPYAFAIGSIVYDMDDSKSISEFVFKLNNSDVSWKSSKQDATTDSTTEAEYIGASFVVKEGVWMRNFFQELGVIPQTIDPVSVCRENTGSIAQEKELMSH